MPGRSFRKGHPRPKRQKRSLDRLFGVRVDRSAEREEAMRKFAKMTILVTALGSALLLAQCGSGRKQIEEPQIVEPVQAAPQPAEDPEAKLAPLLAEAERLFVEGDLPRAKSLVEEILADHPGHARAAELAARLQGVPYATVYPGDTLGEIAGYYYGSASKWTILAKANGIVDPRKVRAYQRIRVPALPDGPEGRCEADRLRSRFFGGLRPSKNVSYVLKQGETLEKIAERRLGDARLASFLADYNHLEDTTSVQAGTTILIPSLSGKTAESAQGRKLLEQGVAACGRKDYKAGCEALESVPTGSPWAEEAERELVRCAKAGADHFEALGDEALKASDPKRAQSCYQTALELDPGRAETQRKLEEVSDMLKAMDLVGSVKTTGK